jgi:hypothetical protein
MPRRDEPLTPDAQRELQALDRALAGADADRELAALVRAVGSERPQLREDFARELDARAAGGFAGRERRHPLTVLRGRLPRRPLLPVLAAAATLALVVVVASSLTGRDDPTGGGDAKPSVIERAPSAPAPGASSTLPAPGPLEPSPDDAPGRRTRRVARSAALTLATSADKVDELADGVVRVTDETGGNVLDSSVSSDERGAAGASFQLSIPSERLRETLAELSKLGDVRSRNQTSQDITGAFISPRERLTDGLAERRTLLRQLAKADTPNETASIRARLRIASSQIASARAGLRSLRARTSFSRVSVSIQTGGTGSGGGVWGVDDALDDALRILAVTLGVVLIALAVALPVIVVVTALTVATRAALRRRHDAALDAG